MNPVDSITLPFHGDPLHVDNIPGVFQMEHFAYASYLAHKLASMPKHVLLNNVLVNNFAPTSQIEQTCLPKSFKEECFFPVSYSSPPFLRVPFIPPVDSPSYVNATDAKVQIFPKLEADHFPSRILNQKNIAESGRVHFQQYRCRFCTRVFSNSSNLNAHIRLHTGHKPFKCRFCDKTSATASNIITHERVHTGVRPFKCDICGAEYSTSSNMKTHRRTHSALRPFVCRLCGRAFHTSSNLTTHLRTHLGLRLYPCITCGRQFSTSSNLHAHVKVTHLGLKPFTCAICSKDFSTGNNLIAHCRSHAVRKSCSPTTPSEVDVSSDLTDLVASLPSGVSSTVMASLGTSDLKVGKVTHS